jgi:hypothetical protein
MNFIATCPSCSNKLRFPIDKGKIKVKCKCGYSFIADPDDTDLYKKGKFDLNDKTARKQKFDLNTLIKEFIEKIYNIKYKLQNFKLLPTSEQKKIILYFLLFLIAIILLFFLMSLSGSNPPEKIII